VAPTIDAILSDLPERGGRAYDALYAAADHPAREFLEMTKAEVWAISLDRWNAVAAAATRAGVALAKLDATANHALVAMAKSVPMSDAQRTMMHQGNAIKCCGRHDHDGVAFGRFGRICADEGHA
jgi:hypothetical protein